MNTFTIHITHHQKIDTLLLLQYYNNILHTNAGILLRFGKNLSMPDAQMKVNFDPLQEQMACLSQPEIFCLSNQLCLLPDHQVC